MLTNAGLDPVVRPASIIETLPFPMNPETATMYLALRKASAIYDEIQAKTSRLSSNADWPHRNTNSTISDASQPVNYTNRDWPPTSDYAIIGADTVVVHEGRIIGKPADKQEAYSILSRLRATSHRVITGCCVIKAGGSYNSPYNKHNSPACSPGESDSRQAIRTCFYEDTKVFFKNYSAAELEEYLSTDEAYDKAGGYAIQGSFGKYIDHIEGDYNNVVGLPLDKVLAHI